MTDMKLLTEFLRSSNTEFMPRLDDDILLYHYTSPAGFQSILHNNPVLWASRFDCLNDISEGTIAMDVYQRVCQRLNTTGEISPELYQFLGQIHPYQRCVFRSDDSTKEHATMANLEYDSYVCSFSRNSDSLAMWNYYSKGNQYEGFNIGFSARKVQEALPRNLKFSLHPVIYDETEQEKMVFMFLDKLFDVCNEFDKLFIASTISKQLSSWSLVFKKSCFRHEEEVRIIVKIPKATDEYTSSYGIARHHRIQHGLIIPYIELKLKPWAVESVCFGPLIATDAQREMQKEVMNQYLTEQGYQHINIRFSDIPVRY